MCVCVCSDRRLVTGSCRRSCVCVCALIGDLSLGLVGRAVCVQLQRYNVFTFICLLIFASLGKVN